MDDLVLWILSVALGVIGILFLKKPRNPSSGGTSQQVNDQLGSLQQQAQQQAQTAKEEEVKTDELHQQIDQQIAEIDKKEEEGPKPIDDTIAYGNQLWNERNAKPRKRSSRKADK
jgi:uncharacterized protein (DUF3084 family)